MYRYSLFVWTFKKLSHNQRTEIKGLPRFLLLLVGGRGEVSLSTLRFYSMTQWTFRWFGKTLDLNPMLLLPHSSPCMADRLAFTSLQVRCVRAEHHDLVPPRPLVLQPGVLVAGEGPLHLQQQQQQQQLIAGPQACRHTQFFKNSL